MPDEMDIIEVKQGLKNLADLSRVFHEALLEQGFTPMEALVLTGNWMTTTLTAGHNNSD